MNVRIAALILVFLALGYGLWHFYADAGRLRTEMAQMREVHAETLAEREAEFARTLSAQQDQHHRALQAMTEEYDSKLSALRQSQRQQMATAFREFESIFEGNRQTLDYINLLEGRVRAGQTLSKVELEKLAVIATGISFLQKQYQKPLQEFTELQEFLSAQTARSPDAKPKARFSFFKRVFSKDYREAEREAYREEGARRAFEAAQVKFNSVYASAQRSMRAVNLDADAQLRKLDELMEDKRAANAEDLSGFFAKARQALRTHQNVLDFEPEPTPESPRVQP